MGTPCILVYLLYVNEVSYLVGKPFIPFSSLSEKLCWSVLEISEDVHLFSVVEEFYTGKRQQMLEESRVSLEWPDIIGDLLKDFRRLRNR